MRGRRTRLRGRIPLWRCTGLPVVLALGACVDQQSAFAPAGPGARDAAQLWWAMLAGGTAIFVLVLVLLLYGTFSSPERRRRVSLNRMVVAGGIILPVVALSLLLPFSFTMGTETYRPLPPEALTVRVRGHQWWWEVEYLDAETRVDFTTANELRLPAGEPVELLLESDDVIHSLWIPRISGKQDLIPGRTNRLVIEADAPGIFRAQCAEYCGQAHAMMALYVAALEPEEYAAWAAGQRQPARAPEGDLAGAGANLFAASGCQLCHTVRGHGAWGQRGPDLTHLGSRLTIGAALVENTPENVAQWIARNHEMKPGNRMPSFAHLDRDARLAIAAYLEGLR